MHLGPVRVKWGTNAIAMVPIRMIECPLLEGAPQLEGCQCYYDFNMEPPLGVIREQGEWPLRPKGARPGVWPKIRKGAGSKENVMWDQGAQKIGKGSREQQKIWK